MHSILISLAILAILTQSSTTANDVISERICWSLEDSMHQKIGNGATILKNRRKRTSVSNKPCMQWNKANAKEWGLRRMDDSYCRSPVTPPDDTSPSADEQVIPFCYISENKTERCFDPCEDKQQATAAPSTASISKLPSNCAKFDEKSKGVRSILSQYQKSSSTCAIVSSTMFRDNIPRCIHEDSKTGQLTVAYCTEANFEDEIIKCRAENDPMDWYEGIQSVTITGRVCKRWDSINANDFGNADLQPLNNYCRNPLRDVCGPWCYTDSKSLKKEYCFKVCISNQNDKRVNCIPKQEFFKSWQHDGPKTGLYNFTTSQKPCKTETSELSKAGRCFPIADVFSSYSTFIPSCDIPHTDVIHMHPCVIACEDLDRTCVPKVGYDEPPFIYIGDKSQTVSGGHCELWKAVDRTIASRSLAKKITEFVKAEDVKAVAAKVDAHLMPLIKKLPLNWCQNWFTLLVKMGQFDLPNKGHSIRALHNMFKDVKLVNVDKNYELYIQMMHNLIKSPWCFVKRDLDNNDDIIDEETNLGYSYQIQECFELCDNNEKLDFNDSFYSRIPCSCVDNGEQCDRFANVVELRIGNETTPVEEDFGIDLIEWGLIGLAIIALIIGVPILVIWLIKRKKSKQQTNA